MSGGTSCWVDWRFTFEVSAAKLLIEDGTEVKVWNDATKAYEKVGDMPITEEMFINFGMENLPNSFEGIRTNIPKIHLYTENENVAAYPQTYKITLIEKKLSLPKIKEKKRMNVNLRDNLLKPLLLFCSLSNSNIKTLQGPYKTCKSSRKNRGSNKS